MKTTNPVIDTLVESQSQFVNNWMESAKKMQTAFAGGSIANEGQSLYKEYFDKQMNVFSHLQKNAGDFIPNETENQPVEFFKKWFNQQATYAKSMADFNQSIQHGVNNFGKPAQDFMANFGQSNTAFTNIYNSWLNTLNSTYDAMSKNMNGTFNKDVFTNFVQGNQMYAKMQEFFQPMAEAMQKGKFNWEDYKNHFTPESYNNITKQMFGSLYNEAALKEAYDNGIKKLHDFFANQNNLSKEYYSQMQNMNTNFPELFNNSLSGNLKEFYTKFENVFGKAFEPLMKIVNPGKEKENVEGLISLMDRIAQYSIKQAELQAHLQNTSRTAMEQLAKEYSEKLNDTKTFTQTPSANEIYAEWVKVNEKLFGDLFATEEFSKAKGEALNLSNDVKKHFEKQFENMFANTPVVFKSEVEELQKTVYELKKQIKELQTKLSVQGAIVIDEEKNVKGKKK